MKITNIYKGTLDDMTDMTIQCIPKGYMLSNKHKYFELSSVSKDLHNMCSLEMPKYVFKCNAFFHDYFSIKNLGQRDRVFGLKELELYDITSRRSIG